MEIKLDHVSKYYQDNDKSTKGIEDVSLTFETDGSFVVITGESGAGKSTLIRILTGLEDFDEGEIYFDGMDVSGLSDKDRLDFYRKNISFVFQDYNLVESFSAEENIVLALIKQGIDTKAAKKRAAEVLAQVGLSEQAKMRTSKLSGGERQRVAIARSLALDTKVIIFDEPTGNLDQERSKQIIDLISSLCKNRLILYVTHEYQQVIDVVTRHIVLADGAVIKDENIRSPYAMTEVDSGLKKSNHFSLKSYLYASGLFSFRRPGRFIATFIVLLLTAWAFFGTGLLCAGVMELTVGSGYTYSGFGLGNTVLIQKNSYTDPDYVDEDAFLDVGDYFGESRTSPCVYLNTDYTIDSYIDDYSYSYTGSYNFTINNALPEKYTVYKKAANPAEDGIYLVMEADLTSSYAFNDFEALIGQKVYLSTYSIYSLTIKGSIVTSTFKSFPQYTLNGIYFYEKSGDPYGSILYRDTYIYLNNTQMQAMYDLYKDDIKGDGIYQAADQPSRSYSIACGDMTLTSDFANIDTEKTDYIVLNTAWKDDASLTLDMLKYSIPLSDTDYVEYSDEIEKYRYAVHGNPMNRIIEDKKLIVRAFYKDKTTAEKKAKELSSSYAVTYTGERTYQLSDNIGFDSTQVYMRFLVMLLFIFLIGVLVLIISLVRNILGKFYYRKDNDQMVLGYIGYSRKDMLFINLSQFLSLMLLFDIAIYALVLSFFEYARMLFMVLPGLFIFTIALSLLFSVVLALPNRRRAK